MTEIGHKQSVAHRQSGRSTPELSRAAIRLGLSELLDLRPRICREPFVNSGARVASVQLRIDQENIHVFF